jgi:purine-cytosine permease-like protein
MYFIGMAGGLLFGSPDPTKTMLAANLGLTALAIIGLSTVTTTFLDVYSAGMSLLNIFPKMNDRLAAVLFAAAGTLVALVFPMTRYTDFLYLLGSVFSPLIAILLVDYFVVKQDSRRKRADAVAVASLIIGIAFYSMIKAVGLPVGATLAAIVFTAIIHLLLRRLGNMAAGRADHPPKVCRIVPDDSPVRGHDVKNAM